jgi:hypothetical protein
LGQALTRFSLTSSPLRVKSVLYGAYANDASAVNTAARQAKEFPYECKPKKAVLPLVCPPVFLAFF